ncbi:MAG TPA: hypothetical protein DHU72_03040 [Rikenellaceae bacterium]|nr:hypothetical protein [Rikenellaceae bacterium]
MISFDASLLSRLASFMEDARQVTIAIHTHPDGDALGSAEALRCFLLQEYDVAVRIVSPDRCPLSLGFLYDEDSVIVACDRPDATMRWIDGSDLIFCLDINGFGRTAQVEPYLRKAECRKVLVDHHLEPEVRDFDIVFSTTEVSSTCELLFWILLSVPGSQDVGDWPCRSTMSLMTGMTTDTNNFANSVFPSTFEMASMLIGGGGVDRNYILSKLYSEYRENRFRAMGDFLQDKLKITDKGVAYAVFRAEDWHRFGLMEGETEGFVNIPLGIEKVKMSIFLREENGVFRVSIRSKKGWSANLLASRYFHGGGHECASGGRLRYPEDIADRCAAEAYIEDVTARFLQEFVS